MFFSTVMWGNSPTFWMVYPMPRRRAAGSAWAASRPFTSTRPPSGAISAFTSRRAVVLPQPERPITVRKAPCSTDREKSRRTGWEPKDF